VVPGHRGRVEPVQGQRVVRDVLEDVVEDTRVPASPQMHTLLRVVRAADPPHEARVLDHHPAAVLKIDMLVEGIRLDGAVEGEIADLHVGDASGHRGTRDDAGKVPARRRGLPECHGAGRGADQRDPATDTQLGHMVGPGREENDPGVADGVDRALDGSGIVDGAVARGAKITHRHRRRGVGAARRHCDDGHE
jgi:hypothetical protein